MSSRTKRGGALTIGVPNIQKIRKNVVPDRIAPVVY